MKETEELLKAPLTPHETIWATGIADKLPDDVDLTFHESKILTRVPIRQWPNDLLTKVKDVINAEDFLTDDPEE